MTAEGVAQVGVAMSGRGRLAPAAAVLAVVAAVLAWWGLARAGEPLAGDVGPAEPSVWAGTGLPYGVQTYSGRPATLSYRNVSVRLPATTVVSASATADSAIFALRPPDTWTDAEVYRLTEAGKWERISTDLQGIPLADIGGHLVVWAEGDDGEVELVGYDTEQGKVVDTVPPDDLVDGDGTVTSVDGGVAMIQQDVPAADGETLSRAFSWAVGTDPAPVLVDGLSAGEWVSTHSSETGLRMVWTSPAGDSRLVGADGSVVDADLRQSQFGLFNPDGSLLALTNDYPRNRGVYDTVGGEDVRLDLRDDFRNRSYAWTADHRLVVSGNFPNEPPDASGHFVEHPRGVFLCTPATGACEDLGDDYLASGQTGLDLFRQLFVLRGPEPNEAE